MEIIKTLIWVIQIMSAVAVIVLVLLQHGKGADAGATFGSGGGSGSLFGASGSANFKPDDRNFATVFFIATFGLVLLSSNGRIGDAGVMAGLNGKVAASNPLTGANVNGSVAKAKATKDQKNQIPQ